MSEGLSVLEALAPLLVLGGASEVVDGDGVHPGLGEALGELLVELVQPAHVGQDQHAGAARRRSPREVGRKAGAVGRGQLQRALVRGRAGDRRQGRPGVIAVAHALKS